MDKCGKIGPPPICAPRFAGGLGGVLTFLFAHNHHFPDHNLMRESQRYKSLRPNEGCLFILILLLCFIGGPALPVFGQMFTRITEGAIGSDRSHTFGASWVDFDDDGDLDLFVSAATRGSGNLVYRNDNDSFTRLTEGVLANDPGIAVVGSCWADYDNDGDLDVFNAGVPNSFLYRNDGQALFTKITSDDIGDGTDRRGWSCAWGDYNDDGYIDLFIAHPAGFVGPPIENSLFENNGDGSFSRITNTPITDGLAPYTVGNWIDYDDDGDLDLFIGSGPAVGTIAPDFLYHNQLKETGSASFVRITELPLNDARDGQTWNFIDYDNDGDRDGFVTNYSGGFPNGMPNSLYRNDSGVFTTTTSGPLVNDEAASLANVWSDFDNDGDLDVFITNEFGFDNVYYRNDGAPSYAFVRTDAFDGTTQSNYGASAGDFDLDGDLDLFFPSGFGGGNHFYRNDSQPGNSWVSIKLVGTESNAAGVGAQIRAKATIGGKAVWQRREVSTQNTFNGHNSLDVHFGLGNASRISKLEITWPSDRVESFSSLNARTFYVAIEGEGVITLAEFLLRKLQDRVEALVSADVLNNGQATALLSLLHQAIERIADGNDHAAANNVQAFQNQVEALLLAGILSDDDARALLDPAGNAWRLLGGSSTSKAGNLTTVALSSDLPQAFALDQNHPNPFNPSTSIAFSLPEETHVRLSIYDLQGRQVASLVDGVQNAGRHEVRWEPDGLASGLYLYRIEAGEFMESRLLHLLK